MMQSGFFDERLAKIFQSGDPLEAVAHDFKIFRLALERTVPRADRSRGGRPAHVLMFKILILCMACPMSRPSFSSA